MDISISNEIPILTLQISVKSDPYSTLDKPQKHTLRGRTSGRSFTLSAPGLLVTRDFTNEKMRTFLVLLGYIR